MRWLNYRDERKTTDVIMLSESHLINIWLVERFYDTISQFSANKPFYSFIVEVKFVVVCRYGVGTMGMKEAVMP
jgi:hypothetical protein